jgi:DnaJ-domain-containing protein 1
LADLTPFFQNSKTMSKEAIISSSRLNCYGTRVLTEGGDLEQYRKNPTLLYMHRRGSRNDMPIGIIENLRVEGDFIYGTPKFDTDTEEEKIIAAKWERGTLRMLSAGIEILEWSEDPQYLVQGQTRPTIVKWKLEEVSVVDIGANDDALQLAQLYKDGKPLTLAMGEENEHLPLLNTNTAVSMEDGEAEKIQTNKTTFQMNKILLKLGLPTNATEDAVVQQIEALMNENKQLRLAAINDAVAAAIAEHRITEAQKAHFVNLGEKVGIEELRNTLSCFQPVTKPTDVIRQRTEHAELKWENCTPEQLEKLRNENRQEYCKLYKEHYGVEAQF